MRQASVHLLCSALLGAAVCIVGCDSDAKKVCANTGACSQGGSSEWIARCHEEANILKGEANDTGCRPQYDSYYACANEHFECHGATTSFPSCDEKSSALSQCLASAGENSACGQLEARNAACTVAADGGEPQSDAGTAPPTGCDLNRECQARCFLDHVPNTCAPNIDELAAYTDCAVSCPP
jgi:hypothetical protein